MSDGDGELSRLKRHRSRPGCEEHLTGPSNIRDAADRLVGPHHEIRALSRCHRCRGENNQLRALVSDNATHQGSHLSSSEFDRHAACIDARGVGGSRNLDDAAVSHREERVVFKKNFRSGLSTGSNDILIRELIRNLGPQGYRAAWAADDGVPLDGGQLPYRAHGGIVSPTRRGREEYHQDTDPAKNDPATSKRGRGSPLHGIFNKVILDVVTELHCACIGRPRSLSYQEEQKQLRPFGRGLYRCGDYGVTRRKQTEVRRAAGRTRFISAE